MTDSENKNEDQASPEKSRDLWVDGNLLTQFDISYEETTPRSFRFAIKPCGSTELQGGYFYHSGRECGLRWKALPVVYVNECGDEVDQPAKIK